MSVKPHLDGTAEFRYPFVGDPPPPGGAQVLLLTEGGVCVRGQWNSTGAFHAWAPLPKTDKDKMRRTQEHLAELARIVAVAAGQLDAGTSSAPS